MTNKPFWIVWGGNKHGVPVVPHDSLESAQAEADRLARIHRESEFFVLSSVTKCKVSDISRTDLRPEDEFEPPF